MGSELQKLENFVKDALQHGRTRAEISSALQAAAWPFEQIRSALDAFADVDFPVAVPKRRPSLSAHDAFLYLLLFASLYYASWNLGSLIFSFIDIAFPDPSDRTLNFFQSDQKRWSTAAVIIAFPVFFFVARHISVQIQTDSLKRLSPVRRWTTYVTLFLASTVLIGDTTTLVYNLLGGEYATRFLLKVLVVAVIAGSIFGYYLLDLRKEERS